MTGALFQAGLVGDLSHFLCKQRPSLRPPRKSNLALDKEDGRTDGIIRMQAGWAAVGRGVGLQESEGELAQTANADFL